MITQGADTEAVIDLGLYREEKDAETKELRRKYTVNYIKYNNFCPVCFEIMAGDEAERHVQRHVEAGDEL